MEITRTRDVVVLYKDLAIPVRLDSSLLQAGWPGGQGVQWAPSSSDNLVVMASDGVGAAFLLWGSNEESDQFVSYTQNQLTSTHAVACTGTWIISTSSYESHTYESRQLGPLVANTFVPGEQVFFSYRGLLTPQDEWDVNGDPRAPNPYPVGTVIQVPDSTNNFYLMLQTSL